MLRKYVLVSQSSVCDRQGALGWCVAGRVSTVYLRGRVIMCISLCVCVFVCVCVCIHVYVYACNVHKSHSEQGI